MKSRLERATPLLITIIICVTLYLCVRECNKALVARWAIEKGIIIGVKPHCHFASCPDFTPMKPKKP